MSPCTAHKLSTCLCAKNTHHLWPDNTPPNILVFSAVRNLAIPRESPRMCITGHTPATREEICHMNSATHMYLSTFTSSRTWLTHTAVPWGTDILAGVVGEAPGSLWVAVVELLASRPTCHRVSQARHWWGGIFPAQGPFVGLRIVPGFVVQDSGSHGFLESPSLQAQLVLT